MIAGSQSLLGSLDSGDVATVAGYWWLSQSSSVLCKNSRGLLKSHYKCPLTQIVSMQFAHPFIKSEM